jgi:hypothetical protein
MDWEMTGSVKSGRTEDLFQRLIRPRVYFWPAARHIMGMTRMEAP